MDMKNTIEMVSGHLAVEGQMAGAELLKAMNNEGVKAPDVARAIRVMVNDGAIEMDELSITKSTITYIKEFTGVLPTAQTPTAPAKEETDASYGYDECINSKGEAYKYKRTAFDGPVTNLDEEHEAMKEDFLKFKQFLRDVVPECNGVGKDAITMFDPANPYANKDGKVFYRWTNATKTQPLMDELHPKMMKEVRRVLEGLLSKEGGEE